MGPGRGYLKPRFASEAFGPHVLRAAVEMVDTEILELRAVLEHVVDGREQ
jgi:hypothetical protein